MRHRPSSAKLHAQNKPMRAAPNVHPQQHNAASSCAWRLAPLTGRPAACLPTPPLPRSRTPHPHPLPKQQRRHGRYAGVQVGEARHPGPAVVRLDEADSDGEGAEAAPP